MTTEQIKKFKQILSKPKRIVIVTHWSPDGDAMGSSLGLYNYLIKKKHKVTVVTPNDYPHFLFWLPGNNKVINFAADKKKATNAIEKAEIICCLDFNSLKRIEDMGPLIERSAAIKLNVDHHPQPDGFAEYMLHTTQASSTAELIYDLISLLGDKKLIDKKIASCLYTGIITDTGNFRFPSTTPKTHRVVADLIDAGADNSETYNSIYDDNTEDRLKLLGYALCEKLKVFPELHAAYFNLSAEELKRFHYKKGDTEGLVNYALSIKGIKFAAFFVDRDGIIKISFRSKGNFDVNAFARMHFDGGGHRNAAGGNSNLTLAQTVEKFEKVLPPYKSDLIKS